MAETPHSTPSTAMAATDEPANGNGADQAAAPAPPVPVPALAPAPAQASEPADKRVNTSVEQDVEKTAGKKGSKREPPRRDAQFWTQVGIRTVFVLIGAALLGVAGHIAATAGATNIEKVYAAALSAAVLSIATDIIAFLLLLLRPAAAPAVCPLDGITIILAAVGIPSILNSSSQTTEDGVTWKLTIVIIAARILSIAMCIALCVLKRRQKAAKHVPKILEQKRRTATMSTISSNRNSIATASTSTRTPKSRSVAHSVITEEEES
ncbi:hypothetical protein GQ53DRAFT_826229 [Thozetella sp. PMI_491]|nr:hypothetical protein GQ53DRAFT_826229 [Thozetella sp. PMI_491]